MWAKVILSMKTGVFVAGKLYLRLMARKRADFLAEKVADKKKRHPRKDVSVKY